MTKAQRALAAAAPYRLYESKYNRRVDEAAYALNHSVTCRLNDVEQRIGDVWLAIKLAK